MQKQKFQKKKQKKRVNELYTILDRAQKKSEALSAQLKETRKKI